ncbi:hypothetical protein L2Y96_01000 [Luteibacter aegosomaticola]|jgi:hypothetical protein|uniref:bestrophin-like domain n=1 Tax=Luteibacter aegosomaticola TaxID=2911538 RepID=UPI001FF9282D|nr:hypothetical protein [Luteibacter aegosomaticola]UPG90377.1 hypothetical protein L2Y96_01000 [Luteibacter aegosomaticola]
MFAILVSLGVLLLACASLFLGEWIARRMPEAHRVYEAQKSAQFGLSMMATLAALVLGFMVTSARATFDRANDDIVGVATSTLLLDRALSGYGPETTPIRADLRTFLDRATARVAPDGEMKKVVFRLPQTSLSIITLLQRKILALQPQTEAQWWFQHRALECSATLARERILTSEHEKSSEPLPLLAVVTAWIVLIFIGMGIFAMHNPSVRIVLFCAALAFSGSIFLVMELEAPYTGLLRVSGVPLQQAAEELGKP